MRCGEHFELEAALDGGGPSQAPRRAASQPPRDPPRRPGTPHSPPPPPDSPIDFSGRGWGVVCELLLREGVCLCASHPIIHGRVGRVPAIILSTAGLGMPGRACRAYPIDLRERLATRCIPFPCMPARRPHLLYTRMALLSMTRAATRAREACVSPGDVEVYRVNRNNHYTLEDTGEIRDILETDKRGRS
jgi:hypothetical protein